MRALFAKLVALGALAAAGGKAAADAVDQCVPGGVLVAGGVAL